MNISLAGKTALVTGSTSGIGLAIAKGLAAAGAETIVNGRSPDKVERAAADLRRAAPGAKVRGVAADVGTADGCEALVRAVPKVDILINNAGIFEPKDFFAIPDSDWTRFLEINVMSGVRLSRAYMQGMLGRDWGRIVFISSESGLQIPPEMIHYGVTKTAQLGLSRGLAELTGGTGRLPCCNASPASMRSRTWWCISPRRKPRPPTARPCASMAASCAPLRDACASPFTALFQREVDRPLPPAEDSPRHD